MGVPKYRPAALFAEHHFASVSMADNGQEPREPVEIAVAILDGGFITEPLHVWLTRPTQPISPYATQDHGLTNTDVQSAPALPEILSEVRATLRDRALVAHRSDQIKCLLTQVHTGQIPVLDIRRLSHRIWPTSSRALGELLRLADITLPGTLGRAGHDALATARLLLALANHIRDVLVRNRQSVSATQVIEWATAPTEGPTW